MTATLSHFMGAYGASDFSGTASGSTGSSVRLVNDAGYSGLLQSVMLGGLFSFDLIFDVSTGGLDGSSFTAMLYNADFSATLGMDTPLVEIDLMPGQADVVSPVDDEHAARQLSCTVDGLRRIQGNVMSRAEAGGAGNGAGNAKVQIRFVA